MLTTRNEVLRRALDQKTVRVLVRCVYVDTDGTPLDMNGDSPDGSKGWRQGWEWAKRNRPRRWLQRHPRAWKPIIARKKARA